MVFPLSSPTKLEDFSLIDLIFFSFYLSGPEVWYSRIWFSFFTFLFVGKKFFHPFHKSNIMQHWQIICLSELAPKKKDNCNIVITQFDHVTLLVILIQQHSTISYIKPYLSTMRYAPTLPPALQLLSLWTIMNVRLSSTNKQSTPVKPVVVAG